MLLPLKIISIHLFGLLNENRKLNNNSCYNCKNIKNWWFSYRNRLTGYDCTGQIRLRLSPNRTNALLSWSAWLTLGGTLWSGSVLYESLSKWRFHLMQVQRFVYKCQRNESIPCKNIGLEKLCDRYFGVNSVLVEIEKTQTRWSLHRCS